MIGRWQGEPDRHPEVVALKAELARWREVAGSAIFNHENQAAQAWMATYEKWMNARARAGNAFALSLGYGKAGQQ